MTPRKMYRLGLTMALAGGLGIVGFAAPALAKSGGAPQASQSGQEHANANGDLGTGVKTTPPGSEGGQFVGSQHNGPIPPGIKDNPNAKGLCSDYATPSSLKDNQGRGRSQKGNPAHDCHGGYNVPGTTPTNVAPATVTTVAPTSVLGETITAPAAPTSAPVAAPTAVKKLPFTGPGHVGTLAGIGFSTLLLGGGLLLASRRQPLATVSG